MHNRKPEPDPHATSHTSVQLHETTLRSQHTGSQTYSTRQPSTRLLPLCFISLIRVWPWGLRCSALFWPPVHRQLARIHYHHSAIRLATLAAQLIDLVHCMHPPQYCSSSSGRSSRAAAASQQALSAPCHVARRQLWEGVECLLVGPLAATAAAFTAACPIYTRPATTAPAPSQQQPVVQPTA
jgi:hypothetical protein